MYAGAAPQDPKAGGPPGAAPPVRSGPRLNVRRGKKRRNRQKPSKYLESIRWPRAEVKPYRNLRLAANPPVPSRPDADALTTATVEQHSAAAADALVEGMVAAGQFEIVGVDVVKIDAVKSGSAGSSDVVLVTQCSWDRLNKLVRQSDLWEGPLAAAVLLRVEEDDAAAKLEEVAMELFERLGRRRSAVRVTLCAQLAGSSEDGHQWGEYPINHLR